MEVVLRRLASGEISVTDAEKELRLFSVEKIQNMARIDNGREYRRGLPEVLLGEGKTKYQFKRILNKALQTKGRVIISRTSDEQLEHLHSLSPRYFTYINTDARIAVIGQKGYHVAMTGGVVGIITAGTSDISVAEESRVVASEMGCQVRTAYDVGVAGLHRVFPVVKKMIKNDVDVMIVAAGREGALPSVVAGMVDIPIIALPTSIGYGLGEKGLSALISMLQSCSLGIAVVNIDGGVAAGATAALIANRIAKARKA